MKEQTYTHKELDALVVNIELTLVSIIQGVALAVLTENSSAAVAGLHFIRWPYVASGLVVILLFWSRSLLHTLTVIRWPLEFAHNFLYIASTLLEAIIFTQLANPTGWFAVTVVYGLAIWLLFAVDLRMIRKRLRERNGAAAHALLTAVEREQLLNVRLLLPSAVLFNLGVVALLRLWPQLFIERRLHVIFGALQLLCAVGYLLFSLRFYRRLLPLMVAAQYEWNGEVMPAEVTGDGNESRAASMDAKIYTSGP